MINLLFAVAELFPLGTIVERRMRSPLEDPVKNGASFNDRYTPYVGKREAFDV